MSEYLVPSLKSSFDVISIRFASDDPMSPQYWVKVYYAARFCADVVINLSYWQQKESLAIRQEQSMSYKMMHRYHMFAFGAKVYEIETPMSLAYYCAPYELHLELTERIFRKGKVEIKLKLEAGLAKIDVAADSMRKSRFCSDLSSRVLEKALLRIF